MNHRNTILLLIGTFLCSAVFSQYKTDKKLEARLYALTDTFHGVAGIYVRNLRTNKEVAINADTIFPTASIIKVPILVGMFDRSTRECINTTNPWSIATRWPKRGPA